MEPEASVFAPFEPPGDEAAGEGDVGLEGLELLPPVLPVLFPVLFVAFKALAEEASMSIATSMKTAKTRDLLKAITSGWFGVEWEGGGGGWKMRMKRQ